MAQGTEDVTADGEFGVTHLGIEDLVDELTVALVNARIYWPRHPRVVEACERITAIVPELVSRGDRASVRIGVAGEQLVHDERPLLGVSLSAPRLIRSLQGRGLGGLDLDPRVSIEELLEVLELLTDAAWETRGREEIVNELETRGVRHVQVLPPYQEDGRAVARAANDRVVVSLRLYQSLVTLLQDTTISLCHGGVIRFDRVRAEVEQVLGSLEQDDSDLLSLSCYERYDAFTFGHSIRVAVFAMHFARTMTEDRDLVTRIGVAALLHDVGKVRVPFDVLHCKGRLTAEQWREMERHPGYGAEILLDHEECDPIAYTTAFGHHVREDGGGYPPVPKEARLSKITKIVKICDVYEALTAARPYKSAMTPLRALRVMLSMEGHFDESLLRRFVQIMGAFPNGSFVRLDDGRIARVRRQGATLGEPLVEILSDAEGSLLEPRDRFLLDLAGERGAGCRIEAPMAAEDLQARGV